MLPLVLLLMYIVGSSTFLQFHHHSDIFEKAYEKATTCEKIIHFVHVDQEECCQHDAHLSPWFIKCFLCDHHVFPSYLTTLPNFSFITLKVSAHFSDFIPQSYSSSPFTIDNKGPPFFLPFS